MLFQEMVCRVCNEKSIQILLMFCIEQIETLKLTLSLVHNS